MGICMSMEPLNENQIMACCPSEHSTKEEEKDTGITRKLMKGESTLVEAFPSTCAPTNKNVIVDEEEQCVESIASSESSDSMCIIDNHVEMTSDCSSNNNAKTNNTESKSMENTCKIAKKSAIIHKKSIPTIFIQFASHKRLSKSYFMEGADEKYLSPSEVF